MEATTGLIDQWAFNTCVCLHVYFNTLNSQYSVIQETKYIHTRLCSVGSIKSQIHHFAETRIQNGTKKQ